MTVIISREHKDIFVHLIDDGIIEACMDEDGNTEILTEKEKGYVKDKFNNGECDSLYSWGK
jgi:hypothetical protein